MLTVSYSINGVPITQEELKNIQIKRKDYIDYIEDIKNTINKDIKKFPQNTKASKVC